MAHSFLHFQSLNLVSLPVSHLGLATMAPVPWAWQSSGTSFRRHTSRFISCCGTGHIHSRFLPYTSSQKCMFQGLYFSNPTWLRCLPLSEAFWSLHPFSHRELNATTALCTCVYYSTSNIHEGHQFTFYVPRRLQDNWVPGCALTHLRMPRWSSMTCIFLSEWKCLER